MGIDNSYHPAHHSLKNIDYYISAGTPEWAGKRLVPLFESLVETEIPHSFIGIGCSTVNEVFSFPSLSKLLDTADVLTARDEEAHKTIAPLGGILLPCPGFLCGELPTKPRIKAGTIGLIFMSANSAQKGISPRLGKHLIDGYQEVINNYNAIIICHYIDEALEARNIFPGTPVYYSYDAKDFESFYALCDLVIGPRLHGVLLAAGIGIPSYITRAYDEGQETRRIGATEHLGIPSLLPTSPIGFLEAIKNMDINKESKRLIALRYDTEATYINLLATRIPSLFTLRTPKDKALNTVRDLVTQRRFFDAGL